MRGTCSALLLILISIPGLTLQAISASFQSLCPFPEVSMGCYSAAIARPSILPAEKRL